MFLIISYKDGQYGVLDTTDGVTEYYTKEQLLKITKQVQIRGISPTGEIYCKSDSVITDFINLASASIAKLMIMGIQDVSEENTKALNVARKLGLADDYKDLSFDYKRKSIIFHKLNLVVPYEDANTFQTFTKLDVCDESVVKLSKLGIEAFKYITIEIGGRQYSLVYLLDLLSLVSVQLRYENIWYIGITPSNKLFKIVFTSLSSPAGTICVSVKFDTLGELKRQYSKIIGQKVESYGTFRRYIRECVASKRIDTDVVITKVTVKSIGGSDSAIIYRKLKDKYKTLQDVYVGFEP